MIVPRSPAFHFPLAGTTVSPVSLPGSWHATKDRMFVPSPRHALVLGIYANSDDVPDSVENGFHLTEADTPALAGLPLLYPRYLYVGRGTTGVSELPSSSVNYPDAVSAVQADYPGGLASTSRAIVQGSGGNASDVHRWITGPYTTVSPEQYQGGDLFAALILDGSMDGNHFSDGTGLWEVMVSDGTIPLPAGAVLIEHLDLGGGNFADLFYYSAILDERAGLLAQHAARFRKFMQKVYAAAVPIRVFPGALGGPVFATTYQTLYGILCPGPTSSVSGQSTAAAAGTQCVTDAATFFAT